MTARLLLLTLALTGCDYLHRLTGPPDPVDTMLVQMVPAGAEYDGEFLPPVPADSLYCRPESNGGLNCADFSLHYGPHVVPFGQAGHLTLALQAADTLPGQKLRVIRNDGTPFPVGWCESDGVHKPCSNTGHVGTCGEPTTAQIDAGNLCPGGDDSILIFNWSRRPQAPASPVNHLFIVVWGCGHPEGWKVACRKP